MRQLRHLIILCALVFALVACEEEVPVTLPTRIPTLTPTLEPTLTPTSFPTPLPTNTPDVVVKARADTLQEQSYLRIMNAMQGLPPIKLYVESQLYAFALGYGLTTNPSPITEGTYIIRVATEEPDGSDRLIIEQVLTIDPGTTQFLLLTGTTNAPELNIYQENQAALHANESRVTFIHSAANAPAFNLQRNGVDLASPIAFNEAVKDIVLPSEPSTFTLLIDGQPIIDYALTLAEHHHYTLVILADTSASGDASPEFSIAKIDTPVPGFATIRVVNASQTMPVDFYANGTLLVEHIDPTRASERLQMPTGFYSIAIYPAGALMDTDTALTSIEFNLNTSDDISLISMGDTDDWVIMRIRDDLSAVAPQKARITFVHTLSSPPLLRIVEGETAVPGISDLRPHQASSAIILDAKEHTFHWQLIGSDGSPGDSAEAAMDIELVEGRNYLYLMTGRDDGSPPIIMSEAVEIDETLITSDEDQLPPQNPPAYVRLINTLADNYPIDYVIDGITMASALQHGQPTTPIIITDGLHAVSLRQPGGGDLHDLAILDYDFRTGAEYAIYAYGMDAESSELLVIQTFDLGEDNPAAYLRFINTTPYSGTRFTLAYAISGQGGFVPTPDPNTNPSETGNIPFREPIFASTIPLANELGSGEASPSMPIQPQNVDFYIVDLHNGMAATTIIDYKLEAGIRYDIIAYQETASTQVHALVIPYTQP